MGATVKRGEYKMDVTELEFLVVKAILKDSELDREHIFKRAREAGMTEERFDVVLDNFFIAAAVYVVTRTYPIVIPDEYITRKGDNPFEIATKYVMDRKAAGAKL